MGRMLLPSVGLGGIARCRSPPFFDPFLSLVFREPKLDFTKKIRLAQGRSRFLAEPYLAGWDREQERTGATMHVLDRVSEGQLNERLMNAAGRVGRANNSNAFGLFFEQESQRYLTLPSP